MPVKVWDLPVRICHWLFALILPAMWWTAENGEMGWHIRLGLLLLVVLVFRVLWGFAGSSTARFSSFVRGPARVIAHLRGNSDNTVLGHNPAGGWSVIAMLLAMIAQVSFGLFAGDPYDGATGPLNSMVRTMTADSLTDLHETFFYVVLALVVLHLLAIAWYVGLKRDNIVRPMITGSRVLPETTEGTGSAPAWRVIACLLPALALAWWIWSYGG